MWPLNGRNKTKQAKKLRKAVAAGADPTSIGNLIVQEGIITQSTLERLIEEFHSLTLGQLLGEFLLSRKDVPLTKEKLELLLLKQKTLRGQPINHEDMMKTIEIADNSQQKSADELCKLRETLLRAT